MSEHFPKQYMDVLAPIDASRNVFTPVWDEILAKGHRPTKLVDVGCGTGIFSAYVQRRTQCAVSGVDGSEYALSQARQIGFTDARLIADFNTDPLPFDDGAFDFAVCKDVLEHLLNPLHLVRECHRILAPSGLLLLHVPNHFPLLGRIKFLLTNDIDTFGFFPWSNRWEYPHVRFYEHAEFTTMAAAVGFTAVGDFSHCFPVVPVLNRLPGTLWAQRSIAKRSPAHFAGGFTILLRKNP